MFFDRGNIVGCKPTRRVNVYQVMYRFGAITRTIGATRSPIDSRRSGPTESRRGIGIRRGKVRCFARCATSGRSGIGHVDGVRWHFLSRGSTMPCSRRTGAVNATPACWMDAVQRVDEIKHSRTQVPSGDHIPRRLWGCRLGPVPPEPRGRRIGHQRSREHCRARRKGRAVPPSRRTCVHPAAPRHDLPGLLSNSTGARSQAIVALANDAFEADHTADEGRRGLGHVGPP